MITLRLERPWLIAELAAPMRCLSWAPHGAGCRMAGQVVWREVRNADLVPGFDAEGWFSDQMARFPGAIGMMTSRDIGTHAMARAAAGEGGERVSAQSVATVGLTNGEAVGRRRVFGPRDFGTINILVATDAALTEAAQLEALSIAVQARTAAVIEAGHDVPTGRVTGTGTDCLVVACRPGEGRYAGLHTPVGEAIGAAVKSAVATGARDWQAWYAGKLAEAARKGAE